jgi:YD repeat-containing protein
VVSHNNKSYAYNEWDKLTKFTDENGNEYQYKYDTEGNRTQKNGTKYVVDSNKNVIAETNKNNQVTAQNVYGDRILSRKINGNWNLKQSAMYFKVKYYITP